MGAGYATEIGPAGPAFAREELGVEEVVAFTEVHNRASRAVMEKLGMVHLRDFQRVEGDGEVYGFALYATGRQGGPA